MGGFFKNVGTDQYTIPEILKQEFRERECPDLKKYICNCVFGDTMISGSIQIAYPSEHQTYAARGFYQNLTCDEIIDNVCVLFDKGINDDANEYIKNLKNNILENYIYSSIHIRIELTQEYKGNKDTRHIITSYIPNYFLDEFLKAN